MEHWMLPLPHSRDLIFARKLDRVVVIIHQMAQHPDPAGNGGTL
jgi:hypothetical protein